jgi:hypothetical protein
MLQGGLEVVHRAWPAAVEHDVLLHMGDLCSGVLEPGEPVPALPPAQYINNRFDAGAAARRGSRVQHAERM